MCTKWTSGIAIALLFLALVAGWTWAEDARPPAKPEDLTKTLVEASKPGPEHARLQALVGLWNFSCKFWMEPGKPPIETKGTIERKWILGSRFVEERVEGTGFDGKPGFEALGLLGYDPAKQKYTATWACNMGTATSTGEGVCDKSGGFTFQTTCYCPLMKQTLQGREVIRVEGKDRIILESYITLDGKEAKVLEIVSTRKQ